MYNVGICLGEAEQGLGRAQLFQSIYSSATRTLGIPVCQHSHNTPCQHLRARMSRYLLVYVPFFYSPRFLLFLPHLLGLQDIIHNWLLGSTYTLFRWARPSLAFLFAYATLLHSRKESLQACHLQANLGRGGVLTSMGAPDESHMSIAILCSPGQSQWLDCSAQVRIIPVEFPRLRRQVCHQMMAMSINPF